MELSRRKISVVLPDVSTLHHPQGKMEPSKDAAKSEDMKFQPTILINSGWNRLWPLCEHARARISTHHPSQGRMELFNVQDDSLVECFNPPSSSKKDGTSPASPRLHARGRFNPPPSIEEGGTTCASASMSPLRCFNPLPSSSEGGTPRILLYGTEGIGFQPTQFDRSTAPSSLECFNPPPSPSNGGTVLREQFVGMVQVSTHINL